jgi:hypothetical protein
MNRYTSTNEISSSEGSWAYLQVLFESLFSFTRLLNMAMVRNF